MLEINCLAMSWNHQIKKYACLGTVMVCILFACRSKETKDSDQQIAAQQVKPSVQDESLREARRLLEWQEIKIRFETECLGPFLKQKRVQANCSDCDGISFGYELTIDQKGKIIKILKAGQLIRCKLSVKAIKELDNLIYSYLKKQILPSSFYHCTYKGQLGFILKC